MFTILFSFQFLLIQLQKGGQHHLKNEIEITAMQINFNEKY